MAVRVVDQPVLGFEGETLTVPASNGTRDAYNVRPGYQEILIEPVAAMRLQFVPKIAELYFWDDSAARWFDILDEYPSFLNRIDTVDVPYLGGMTTLDRLYVGTVGIIGGFRVNIGSTVNATASELTAQYSPTSGDWTTLTIATDGTAAAGATLAQDGLVTLTVPARWGARALNELTLPKTAPTKARLFWSRYAVSAAVDAGILLENLTVIGRIAPGVDSTTARTGGIWLKATTEYTVDVSEEVGSLEILAQTAVATTARVSWIHR